MDDKLSIRVNIADRYYPLRIDRNDEERIRLAAKLINEKVLQYKQRYSDKDIQDFLAMATLQYVIKLLELENRHDVDPFIEMVRDLNEQLDSVLSEKTNMVL